LRTSSFRFVSVSKIAQACSFRLCPCQTPGALASSARALSPPHRATQVPVTIAVSAPPRCLKHPPAAATTTVVRFQTAAYLFLVIFCLLTLVHFSTSGKLSPLSASSPASKRHLPQLFRILFCRVLTCSVQPLHRQLHSASRLRPCSSSGHGMRELPSSVTLQGEGRRRGLLAACRTSTQRLQLRT
jgi:hypothetical protein